MGENSYNVAIDVNYNRPNVEWSNFQAKWSPNLSRKYVKLKSLTIRKLEALTNSSNKNTREDVR